MSFPPGCRFQLDRPLTAVWRTPHSLQLGLDAQAVILEPVPSAAARVLTCLSEPRNFDELAALNPELSTEWLDWLLARLSDTGLIHPWRARPARPVVVWGTGVLAEGIHAALRRSGLPALPLGQREWPGRAEPLIILATGTIEPDRSLTDRIVAAEHCALVVRAEPERGVVGPLIHAGHTPCLRCLDLHRSDLDPAWPKLVAQLCQSRVVPGPALVEWLTGEAIAEASRWTVGEPSELAGRTLELGLPDFTRSFTGWPPHPACPCQETLHAEPLGTLAG